MAKKQTEELVDNDQAPVEEIPKKAKVAKADKAKTGYEEWICDSKGEKLKLKRAGVQISDEEAEILNAGRTTAGNVNNILMYFKPE